ncbi:MAG: hypothetical protein GEU86_19245 [Actinophytocola sp.]|nr:hypothetical protein [Actinophytocola sp.]
MFAVLAGATNFREAGDRAADLPQELLALAGCRMRPVAGRYVAPSEPTIRRGGDHRAGHGTADADEVRLIGVAMDGKVARNSVAPGGPEGGEVKLFSAMLHRGGDRDPVHPPGDGLPGFALSGVIPRCWLRTGSVEYGGTNRRPPCSTTRPHMRPTRSGPR